jgi:hypothetical protein
VGTQEKHADTEDVTPVDMVFVNADATEAVNGEYDAGLVGSP